MITTPTEALKELKSRDPEHIVSVYDSTISRCIMAITHTKSGLFSINNNFKSDWIIGDLIEKFETEYDDILTEDARK